MKVIIINEGCKQEVDGVTLEEGLIPSISSLTDEESALFKTKIPDIEPALWFKTLVLHTLIINVESRQLTWSTHAIPLDNENNFNQSIRSTLTLDNIPEEDENVTEKPTEKSRNKLLRKKWKFDPRKRMSENMFLHAHGAGQNLDFDALFQTLTDVLKLYNTDKISCMEFYQEIFRMLHICVLPFITFNTEDIPQLQAALEFQISLITRQDERISQILCKIDSLDRDMLKQRCKYGDEMLKLQSGSKLTYPRPLAITLLNHIQDDLQRHSSKLAEIQTDVNLLKIQIGILKQQHGENELTDSEASKTFMRACSVASDGDNFMSKYTKEMTEYASICVADTTKSLSELEADLKNVRECRDKMFENYKKTLSIREILSEYVHDRILLKADRKARISKRLLVRSKLKLNGNKEVNDPLHKMYMGMYEEKENQIQTIQALTEEKVKLISVKEGIKSALDELKTETTTYGIEFDHFGSLRSTDVRIRKSLPTNWMPLEEQVKLILEQTDEPIAKAHAFGCERVSTECKLLKKLNRKILESESDSYADCDTASLYTASYENDEKLSGSLESLPTSLKKKKGKKKKDNSKRKSKSMNCLAPAVIGEIRDGRMDKDYYALHVPYGGMCVPLQHVVSEKQQNHAFYAAHNYSPQGSLMQFDAVEENTDLVIVHDISPEYARNGVNKMKDIIVKHMDDICKRLQVKLEKEDDLNYQKIWICYERIFYSIIYRELEDIYWLAFTDVLNGLKKSVPDLTPRALDMDNILLASILCEKTDSGIEPEGNSTDDGSSYPPKGAVYEQNKEHSANHIQGYQLPNSVRFPLNKAASLDQLSSSPKKEHNSLRREKSKPRDQLTLERSKRETSVYANGDIQLYGDIDIDDASSLSSSHDSESSVSRHNVQSNFKIDQAEEYMSSKTACESTVQASSSVCSKYVTVLNRLKMEHARHIGNDIHIFFPLQVNLNTSFRSTWPAVQKGIEFGQDALLLSNPNKAEKSNKEFTNKNKEPTKNLYDFSNKTIKIKPEFMDKFKRVIELFQEMCKECSPIEKMKKGCLILQELNHQIQVIFDQKVGLSADQFSDVLVLLLCNMDTNLLLSIYVSIQMMQDLSPEFYAKDSYGYSMIQLAMIMMFLQDRIVMQQKLVQNDLARNLFNYESYIC